MFIFVLHCNNSEHSFPTTIKNNSKLKIFLKFYEGNLGSIFVFKYLFSISHNSRIVYKNSVALFKFLEVRYVEKYFKGYF